MNVDEVRSRSHNAKVPKSGPSEEDLRKEWLDSKKPMITVGGKTYGRNHIADKLMHLKYQTVRQRVAVVLRYGYNMGDVAIGALLHCVHKGPYDHRRAAEFKMKKDPTLKHLLLDSRRKNGQFNEDEAEYGSQ